MDLRERWRRHLVGSPKAIELVDALLVNPYLTVARAQRLLKVSNPTARQVGPTVPRSPDSANHRILRIIERIRGRDAED